MIKKKGEGPKVLISMRHIQTEEDKKRVKRDYPKVGKVFDKVWRTKWKYLLYNLKTEEKREKAERLLRYNEEKAKRMTVRQLDEEYRGVGGCQYGEYLFQAYMGNFSGKPKDLGPTNIFKFFLSEDDITRIREQFRVESTRQ